MNASKHYRASTFLLLVFTGALTFGALYSDIFRKVPNQTSNTTLLSNPLRKDILDSLLTLKFTNKNGTFDLIKEQGSWKVVSPVTMNGNNSYIEKLMSKLLALEVRTVLSKTQLNERNFGVSTPSVAIEISSDKDESQTIDLGVMNSIDQTSYLVVNNINAIFQISMPSAMISNTKLADILDARVFNIEPSSVTKFILLDGKTKKQLHVLEKKEGNWLSSKFKQITNASVEKKLASILSLETKVVIDQVDESTIRFMNNYLNNPRYIVRIKYAGQTATYQVSYPTTKNSELKIQKGDNYLIRKQGARSVYLVSRKNYDNFFINYSSLK